MTTTKLAALMATIFFLVALGGCATRMETPISDDVPDIEIAISPFKKTSLVQGESISVSVESPLSCRRYGDDEAFKPTVESYLSRKGYRIGTLAPRYSATLKIVTCGLMDVEEARKTVEGGHGGKIAQGYQGPNHLLDTLVALATVAVTGPRPKEKWVYQVIVIDLTLKDQQIGHDVPIARIVAREDDQTGRARRHSALVQQTGQKIAELF